MSKSLFRLVLILLVVCGSSRLLGDDWPLWRGPDQDGISKETNWNPEGVSKVLWEKRIAPGYSAVSVVGKRAYTMGFSDGEDHVYCLNPETGSDIWKFSYPSNKGGGYVGPRATPVIEDGRLYCFGVNGDVHCVNAETGEKIWRTNVMKLGAKNPKWNVASSPRLTKNLVLINAGKHGVALDKRTGKPVWSSSGIGGYASVVLRGDKGPAIVFGEKALYAVKLSSGEEMWSFPWETQYDVNAADPLVTDKWIFITSGYGKGCAMLAPGKSSARELWRDTSLCSHFSSPIHVGGYIYGVNGNAGRGELVCMDVKNGNVAWKENLGFGSFIGAGDKIIYLNEKGEVTVAELTPKAFKKIASARVLKGAGKCWTMPTLANGRLFCRGSNGKMVCLDLK